MAVGKLVKGSDALKPMVEAFVDDEAGADVAEKVKRRLQHFIDRKTTAAFEPMIAMMEDATLSGLAKGFAFQMAESLGVMTRDNVANDVKALDQDARGQLRKHGIRFGQFTIFMPLLLKPAPTRLRLVLWSLQQGLQEFPEAPPPGLVTVPAVVDAPEGYYTNAGYRLAGERAIRIDMLERLADQLRSEDSRGGFEAKPDMLSITGMTLVQFADLMRGLGYKAEEGERPKVKAVPVVEAKPDGETPTEVAVEEATPVEAEAVAPEMETFFTFAWAGNRGGKNPQRHAKPQGDGKPRGRKPAGKGKPQGKGGKAQNFQARPPKKEKAIDPDNPFAAALMGFKKD
jgi:ATP-dependent RNA helicase SUPV3L1/SUV3